MRSRFFLSALLTTGCLAGDQSFAQTRPVTSRVESAATARTGQAANVSTADAPRSLGQRLFGGSKSEPATAAKAPAVAAKAPAVAAKAPAVAGTQTVATVATVETRIIRRFRDQQEAAQFLQLLSQKEIIANQAEVIEQLTAEKQEELGSINRELLNRFGVEPDSNYDFDAETGLIHQIMVTGTNQAPARTLVTTLSTDDRRMQFMRLATARNLTKEQILAFALVRAEKKLEMEQCDRLLAERYSITPDGTFHYSGDDLALFEVIEPQVPPVAPATSTAAPVRR